MAMAATTWRPGIPDPNDVGSLCCWLFSSHFSRLPIDESKVLALEPKVVGKSAGIHQAMQEGHGQCRSAMFCLTVTQWYKSTNADTLNRTHTQLHATLKTEHTTDLG